MSYFALVLTFSIINTVLWVSIAILAVTAPKIPKQHKND